MRNRDYNLDLIRVFALYTVVSVHFFLNSGFYSQDMIGFKMFIKCIIRSFFIICVPLFLLLTGYLMKDKVLSKKYYKGISNTLIVYIVSSVVCVIFKILYNQSSINLVDSILSILDFTGANYSWYIEMYIGLFLIIPFLNLIYKNLANKKQRQILILILTLLFLTSFHGITNIYVFDSSSWLMQPSSIQSYQKLVPTFWIQIYPITYYFIGSYLSDYGVRLNNKKCGIILIFSMLVTGTISYYWATPYKFVWGPWCSYSSILVVIMSVCVFTLIKRIPFKDKVSTNVKRMIKRVSDVTLGAYLVSYIFDTIFYNFLNNLLGDTYIAFKYYFIIVPVVFVSSILLSMVLDLLIKFFNKCYTGIKNV